MRKMNEDWKVSRRLKMERNGLCEQVAMVRKGQTWGEDIGDREKMDECWKVG